MNKRDKNKRLKGFGIPIDICVKYERLVGVKTGAVPTKKESEEITQAMVASLALGVAGVVLSAEDYELIAQEVRDNEKRSH